MGRGELAAKTELHRDPGSSLLLSISAGAQNEQHSRAMHRKDTERNTGPSSQQEGRLLPYTAKPRDEKNVIFFRTAGEKGVFLNENGGERKIFPKKSFYNKAMSLQREVTLALS